MQFIHTNPAYSLRINESSFILFFNLLFLLIQAIEDAAVLRKELQVSRQELEHLVQRGSDSSSREREWEMERVTFGQKLQEADTKVGGLERLLEERLKACELLTAERDETREILGNREREKIVSYLYIYTLCSCIQMTPVHIMY